MTLPPFPSQDLAKLVLGYLAEEQLMTAYDEFLQASPYLDALKNEYDRIFMTSLKNILAEYRAVKIYVETCKPLVLRKKLVQCTNLLDVVKFLANHADVNKIQAQDTSFDKNSLAKQNTSKQNGCEVCSSLSLTSCACKGKQKSNHSTNHDETSSLDNSLETTALEDLPGNHVTHRKKQARVLEKESVSESKLPSESNIQSSSASNSSSNAPNAINPNTHCSQTIENSSLGLSSITKGADTPECREKIEEFNTILKKVCKNKSQADKRLFSLSESENVNKSIPNASTFQDFASGVGGNENRNVPVPDSSTSENSIALTSKELEVAKDINGDPSNHLNSERKSSEEIPETDEYNHYPYPRIKPKNKDQKIKIISDIKVDKPFPAINNATSTPLMQTIVINGTPAYKQKLPIPSNNYTKDEIMAMPTIIVVPASGPPPPMTQCKPLLTQKLQKAKTKTVPSKKLLGPLVIDVFPKSAVEKSKPDEVQQNVNKQRSGNETGLVKTVDVTKNASVPKDNVIADSLQSSTPHVLPPMRKSSSTPRRNSHIRVLDFTTPRRILHETINEIAPNEPNDKPVEVVVTASPNLVFPETGNSENNIVDMSNVRVHKIETSHYNNLTKDNENKQQIINKKNNWDADLRALAVGRAIEKKQPPKAKPRPRKPKNKKAEIQNEPEKPDQIDDKANKTETDKTDGHVEKKSRSKRKLSPKPKKSKKRRKLEEEEEQYEKSADSTVSKAAVKPTFNIVAAYSTQPDDDKGIEIQQTKFNNEDNNETPEAERLSLHNEIGARLNISEFLETPYKQVLYDIQMETPKFLGSDLPDEPISDIKIMNIPTPRFFDTPKLSQATPSSYSSRPTDYSSGGSYYKPDEQDYLQITDLECPVTSSKEVPLLEVPKEIVVDNKRSSRPVRKCTKNVSYVNCSNPVSKKEKHEKGADDKIEIASSCSDTTSGNSSFDNNKEVKLKTPKNNKSKLSSTSETRKKSDSNKTRKSPMNKDKFNSFMKIKPRRPTPTKVNSDKRTRRKTDMFSQSSSSRSQSKKKGTSKEKNVHITPVATPAPTKSRRKSSTPRKLHCTKTFNSESSGHESPDINVSDNNKVTCDQNVVSNITSQDSDTEQIALRWSDDGSQDTSKQKEVEAEDITKIQEYIQTTVNYKVDHKDDNTGTLQVDLIKRGFDAETAKIIERDLLDTPPNAEPIPNTPTEMAETKKDEGLLDTSVVTDTSVTNELQIVQDAESDDELELSVFECNEGSDNYITCNSEAKDISKQESIKLKDKFSMEVCIDDGVAIRLRATDFNMLFSNDPDNEGELGYSFRETEVAVHSISNIDKLYTPLKDHKAQCFEIFDSTLTSIDTPLKANSPRHKEQKITEIEIVLEEEKVDGKDKTDMKKRKRLQNSSSSISSEEALKESKKTKPEAQYLFNSTNIQNIDIESVLKKLHGP